MSDEPGSPATDKGKTALLMQLIAGIEIDSADGRAAARAILRGIEAVSPGAVEMMAAHLELRRLGIGTTAH